MTPSEHERLREDLAGYVLGGLTVDEQLAVERHLATCTDCRAELSELDPVPVLLTLAADDRPASEPLDETAGEAEVIPLVAAGDVPRTGRRRAGRARVLAVAATIAAVAAAFAIGLIVATPAEPGYGAPVALHAVGASSAKGTVAVRKVNHGVEVQLVVSHLPAGSGTWYECVWWSGGAARSAGSFTSPSPRTHTIELTTAADLHPGWSLAILEHHAGSRTGVPVLESST
jgi:anti-sigma factor RsiW